MAERAIPDPLVQKYALGAGLTLVQVALSPYVIPLRLMLQAASVPFRALELKYWDRRPVIELTDGAYYTVPVVVDGDRTPPVVVYEARDDQVEVPRYVDRKLGLGLFPDRMAGLNQILTEYAEQQLEDVAFRLDDIYFLPSIPDVADRGMGIRHKERKFGKGCIDQWRAQQPQLQARFEELLAPLDQMLSQHSFLTGDRPVYADYAVAGVLGCYTYTGDNQVPARLPHLARWHQALPEVRLPYR